MTPEDLLDEWTAGEQPGMRAHRIAAVRGDLMAATGLYVPRRIPEIERVLLNSPQQIGVVTRKLREAVAESDDEAESDDPDEDSDDE